MKEVKEEQPVTFQCLRKHTVYADTHVDIWKTAKFFVSGYRSAELQDIEPEDRLCGICRLPLSEDKHDPHRPVQTACPKPHVFGRSCLKDWLEEDFEDYDPDDDASREYNEEHYLANESYINTNEETGRNGCPKCRFVFFTRAEEILKLQCRLDLWDQAYARCGIEPSQYEEDTGDVLRKYVEQFTVYDRSKEATYVAMAHTRLLKFATNLKTMANFWIMPLTDRESHTAENLERFARGQEIEVYEEVQEEEVEEEGEIFDLEDEEEAVAVVEEEDDEAAPSDVDEDTSDDDGDDSGEYFPTQTTTSTP